MQSRDYINKQKEILSEEVQKHIENIGKEITEDILKNFDKSVSEESSNLKSLIKESAFDYNKNFLEHSEKKLQDLLKKQFKGNLFGEILSDNILPSIFESGGNIGVIRNNIFINSASQVVSELSKLLTKNAFRNN